MAQESKHIFIATSFEKRSREFAQYLADFLGRFGVRCVFGEDFGGGRISESVKLMIESSSLVIALLQRESKESGGMQNPSQWVIQEAAWAVSNSKPSLLLLEEGVRFSGETLGDVECIRYNADSFSEIFPKVLYQVEAILHRQDSIGWRGDPLEEFIGKIESDITMWADRHDELLGEQLARELRGETD